jgi:hypothetical protein
MKIIAMETVGEFLSYDDDKRIYTQATSTYRLYEHLKVIVYPTV